jgi:integrase
MDRVKPSTVNRELGILHRAFQLGYQQDPPLVGRVPYFPKLTEGEPRKGFLKPEQYRNVLAALPEELKLLFVIAYHVGLRKGALLRIKWEQVDLASSCIWMQGRKANRKPEPVAVPIYGDMRFYHRTRGVFERYNITDQTDTLEAGKLAEEFLNEAHSQKPSQNSSQNRSRPN